MTSDAERRLTSRRGPSLGGLSLLAPALLTLAVPVAAQDAVNPPATQMGSPSNNGSPASGDIISDSDFNAALPSLTPAAAPPQAPSAEVPLSDNALPPIAPATDTALTTPLAPLSGFNAEPLQTAAIAASQPQPQISYTTVVDGLDAINLKNQFQSLSALKAGKGKAVNSSMVRARATEDEALAVRLVKSQGYYDGAATTQITTPPDGAPVMAHLIVTPGQPYRFGLIAINAQPTQPPDLIRNALPLKPGDQIIADRVVAAEANVNLTLQQQGYPFVKVNTRSIVLDGSKLTGDYTLPVDAGQRSVFGGITTEGRVFTPDHIAILERFKKGDLYDSRKVDDLRQALVATGLFSSVSVEPVATAETAPDGSDYVDLKVGQNRGKMRTLAAEAGYSTGEGFTAQGTWTNRKLVSPEGALILTGTFGTQDTGLGATFRRSNDHRRDLTTQLTVSADHVIYTSYKAYTTQISGAVSLTSTPIWQKVWTWSYGFDVVGSREDGGTPGVAGYKTYNLIDAPLTLNYDKSDDLLNPAKGFRLGGQLTPQISLSGGTSTTVRAQGDASYYVPLSPSMVIAARARIASLFGGSLANIAPSRRLYAGGGGSVRGFAYQALGPQDSSGNPTGGRSLTELSLELRYRVGDYGVVPFIDAGQVYDSPAPSLSNLRVGVGVGARLYTNFGPIRIDVATPLNREKKEASIALYVGIGQAF